MGKPFLAPAFELDLHGSASGIPEPGIAEGRLLDGAGSWAEEIPQQFFVLPDSAMVLQEFKKS